MRISDWSSDVCSSDLIVLPDRGRGAFDDIDDERIGEPPRHPRVLNPAIFHQVSAHPRQVDRRHRAVLLRERDVINLESRSEEHTSELQSLMRTSYDDFCLKKKIQATPVMSKQAITTIIPGAHSIQQPIQRRSD